MLAGLQGPTVLLNDNRQIVVSNEAASTLPHLGEPTDPGGTVSFESAPGEGTAFTIRLPR